MSATIPASLANTAKIACSDDNQPYWYLLGYSVEAQNYVISVYNQLEPVGNVILSKDPYSFTAVSMDICGVYLIITLMSTQPTSELDPTYVRPI